MRDSDLWSYKESGLISSGLIEKVLKYSGQYIYGLSKMWSYREGGLIKSGLIARLDCILHQLGKNEKFQQIGKKRVCLFDQGNVFHMLRCFINIRDIESSFLCFFLWTVREMLIFHIIFLSSFTIIDFDLSLNRLAGEIIKIRS